MLRLLHIDNYKIHKHLRLELGNLTVLTGLNSSSPLLSSRCFCCAKVISRMS